MSVQIHCDSPACEKTRPEESSTHFWIRLHDHGIVSSKWGSHLTEVEHHFCSRECLIFFLTEPTA